MTNPHAMAAASIGFSTTPNSSTPSRPIHHHHSGPLGTTPPVLESTSPFDDFMMNSRGMRNLQQRQPYSPDTYTNKFLNTVNSNGSTPVGSYDSRSGVPPNFGGLASPPHASTPNQNYSVLASSLPDHSQQLSTTPTTAELLAERRRRRRESHNAVERRRRDNINEKIKELADLVPEPFLLGQPDANGNYSTVGIAKDEKPNKGTILSKSVDYIKHLQHVIDEQNRRELELQELVQSLQQAAGQPVTEFGYTSAELELSKLGIGPKPVVAATGTSEATATGDISSNDDKTNEYFDYNSYNNQ
ncbi:hypothetical protein TRVA0_010S01442 [Trichomonascus vanleenenianus]|uniref:Rtg1p n=1 Tax=Trichomonascus vanleenenianus TaxID=2268995 RepID=UPI003ECAA4C4